MADYKDENEGDGSELERQKETETKDQSTDKKLPYEKPRLTKYDQIDHVAIYGID